jgi:transposase
MAKPLVSDELWAVVEPLLPPSGRPARAGTRR